MALGDRRVSAVREAETRVTVRNAAGNCLSRLADVAARLVQRSNIARNRDSTRGWSNAMTDRCRMMYICIATWCNKE